MSASLLFTCALIALLLGLAIAGAHWLQRSRQSGHVVHVIDRALQQQPSSAAQDAAAHADQSLWRRTLDTLASVGRHFESGRLGQALLTPEDRLLLDQANRNTPTDRAIFLGLRLVLAMGLPIFLLPWLSGGGIRLLLNLAAAFAAGLLLPKFILSAWANGLRKRVDDELPLLIDLLRLLQGVGVSMDQSLQIIAERFRTVIPVLGREIHDANVAYIHGRPRAQSLRRLSESFGNQDLQSLVQIIVQVHEHGGAVQEPLRQFAERLREQRKMSMKERTGKLSVKMTLVMMLTLLPALMLVLAGPAAISLVSTLAKLRGH
ncbi:type II secretion system F family protein [Dyella caseinilytica]|uniref:Type II secretion system F family protein n=1 Tax=Dyella caseinilytica TaxID=1849581 RepID=A0ABX7GY90_9GAMM|nr:type II secretion system F family protein [Dyella caseinilytica]QRN55462.1 type II secretion system F family protein [Dyella caseinilytica]GGA01870.1 outer membrane protein [Dyella caseinilytica]